MKDNDLINNPLLDDGAKVAKKVMGAHETVQKVMFYGTMLKFAGIGILVLALLGGGYWIFGNIKDAVTSAAIGEAKEVATEKYTEAKEKASEKIAGAKEKAEGTNFVSSLVKFTKEAEAKFDGAVDEALIENGFSPDAPNNCALQDPLHPSSECLPYTSNEIPGEEYLAIKLWDGACPDAHKKSGDLIKSNGKVTENEYRILSEACSAELKQKTQSETERYKREITGDL